MHAPRDINRTSKCIFLASFQSKCLASSNVQAPRAQTSFITKTLQLRLLTGKSLRYTNITAFFSLPPLECVFKLQFLEGAVQNKCEAVLFIAKHNCQATLANAEQKMRWI